MVDVGDARSLGPDALTLEDALSVRGTETVARYNDLVDLDELTRRRVVTEGGTLVGQVGSATFDERTFELTGIEVAHGLFEGSTTIPMGQVITVGEDVVVVTNEVGPPVIDAADPAEQHA